MSVVLEPTVLQKIAEIAENEQRTPSEVVADALELYKSQQQKKMSGVDFLRSIAGQGRSKEHDVSEHDEEILASEIDPIRGWHVDDRDST